MSNSDKVRELINEELPGLAFEVAPVQANPPAAKRAFFVAILDVEAGESETFMVKTLSAERLTKAFGLVAAKFFGEK
jgi:hypothetical protein